MTIAAHKSDRNSGISSFAEPQKRALLEQALDLAIAEDACGRLNGDGTTDAIVGKNVRAHASLYLKQPAVIVCGLEILDLVFRRFDPDVEVIFEAEEGAFIVNAPSIVARINCKARALLTAERTAINLVQRMSAVATMAHQYAEIAKPHGITILDTRKTTPGLRVFERYAVKVGGATNHRFGLSDGIMIKDNHLAVSGGIKNAVTAVKAKFPGENVEVECTSLAEVVEALFVGVNTIMLDNMPPAMVKEAVALIKGAAVIEVSGGINLTNLREYLLPGVDCISIGALTHSVKSVDLSLEVETYS
jgi:nicotinate-nucleotide pyrophosphorylase (carboxylating)